MGSETESRRAVNVKKRDKKRSGNDRNRYTNKRSFSILLVAFVLLAATILGAVTFDNDSNNNGTGPDESYLAADTSWNGLATPITEGDGTQALPYEISTPGHLKFLSERVMLNDTFWNPSSNPKYYILTEDIVLNDLTYVKVWGEGFAPRNKWIPIGTDLNASSVEAPFYGHFDGNGKVVSGIYISVSGVGGNNQGLFGLVDRGTISNVGIDQSYIRGYTYVGGVVGEIRNNGVISNCYNKGTVVGDRVGGVAGFVDGSSMINCYNTGHIKTVAALGT
ncbi:MAG: hypothetical protein LBE47_03225, partial [Methanomassiliicoccaceae archaeon]|nr:hypothetical protein [Methanomassiliicoccaceae archaeon]